MKSLYYLIIIHGNSPELGIQSGQPDVIFDCRLVDFITLNGSPKMRAVIKCALVHIPDWSNNAKKRT